MSVFAPIKINMQSDILGLRYSRTQDEPAKEADPKAADPAAPKAPETK